MGFVHSVSWDDLFENGQLQKLWVHSRDNPRTNQESRARRAWLLRISALLATNSYCIWQFAPVRGPSLNQARHNSIGNTSGCGVGSQDFPLVHPNDSSAKSVCSSRISFRDHCLRLRFFLGLGAARILAHKPKV